MPPAGLYRPAVRVGDLVFLSGAGPVRPDGTVVTGKVGADLDVAAARDAARLTGLQLLAALQSELGSLDNVRQVVKVLGMVNCAPGFNQTPKVIDGCSELLIEVFGEAGRRRGPRSAWPSCPSTSPSRSKQSSSARLKSRPAGLRSRAAGGRRSVERRCG